MKLPPHPSQVRPPVHSTAARSPHGFAHQPAHSPVHAPAMKLRPGEALGHGGEILRRTRMTMHAQNQFDVPEQYKTPGWSYEWVRQSCYGEPDQKNMSTHQMNGWRPVMSTRMPGYFHDAGYQGAINRDGLVLMDRPQSLTDEAIAEQINAARTEKHNEQADFAGVSKLPPEPLRNHIDGDYFTRDNKGNQMPFMTGVRQAVEAAPPSLYPKRDLDISGDA